jgi:membrane-bound lytic murein transglycosylase D
MYLRAFFNISTEVLKIGVFLFSIFTFFNVTAQDADIRESKVPFEIKFADVTFQLNDVTRYMLSQEILALSKNTDLKQQYLKKLALILPSVEPILEKASIPDDFKYLSIYNKFQKTATSSIFLEKGIFWVLDSEKAKDVDLIIDDKIDERKHLLLATRGGVASLKRNQVLHENWGVTLFSHLASRDVLKALEVNRKWTGGFLVLDSPSYNSVLQFLAFKWVLESEFNNFKKVEQNIVYEYKNAAGKTLNLIAADLKLDPKELVENNLWLKNNRVPEGDANILVVIPASRYTELRILDEMSRNTAVQNMDLGFPIITLNPKLSRGLGGIFYTINSLKGIQAEMCDDFVNLAYKADMSNKQFLEFNDLNSKNFLQIGQIYYIEEKKKRGSIPHHIVRNDETLWEISQQYGVKLSSLLKYNRMENLGRLQRGRLVYLQSTRPKNKPIEFIEFPNENQGEPIESLTADNKLLADFEKNIDESKPEKPVQEYEPKVLMNHVKPIPQNKKSEEPIKVLKKEDNKIKNVKEPEVVENQVKTTKVIPQKLLSASFEENFVLPDIRDKEYVVHEVKKGETLYRISVNYKVSVDQLYKLNNLKNNIIEIGDLIIVKKNKISI